MTLASIEIYTSSDLNMEGFHCAALASMTESHPVIQRGLSSMLYGNLNTSRLTCDLLEFFNVFISSDIRGPSTICVYTQMTLFLHALHKCTFTCSIMHELTYVLGYQRYRSNSCNLFNNLIMTGFTGTFMLLSNKNKDKHNY